MPTFFYMYMCVRALRLISPETCADEQNDGRGGTGQDFIVNRLSSGLLADCGVLCGLACDHDGGRNWQSGTQQQMPRSVYLGSIATGL